MFSLLLQTFRKLGVAPKMSETERVALAAGGVWIDGELFSGKPDFRRILAAAYPELSAEERAFLDGPVEEVCRACVPEEVARTRDFGAEVWRLLKEHRFFGLALPKRYGGHEFSALAQSTIFGKLATRSLGLSSVVLIPNSVGPGELLLEVGTEAQREHYLPRLARGDEIPCFALTEPTAGSDAASITSRGVVFRGADGELKIRLDWEKRYITLAPIATLLGLAFQLEDPEHLLGEQDDLGITCALVSTSLPGVEIGTYHDPMGIAFPNGPTRGRAVEIGVDRIIGGPEYAGRGWQMLMEALSGGRAVSLPAQATAGAKWTARVAGAYAGVRRQFGLPIGRFEGIEEPLARIGGLTYLMEAGRVFTCGAIDSGLRPSVVSAMIKYNATDLGREVIKDGMDVLAGAAICRGPRNLLADGYISAPIGITVEGANILTRTLIVFGQGALRCHPHAHHLLEAVRTGDVKAFRRAFIGQTLHVARNFLRGALLGLSRGRLASAPVSGETAIYYKKLAWASARFAFHADLAMATLGGQLKFRGKLTGRLADILSWMYLATATLRRFEAEGRRAEDLPLVRWALDHSLARIQESFEGFFENYDAPLVGWWVRGPVRWWARLNPLGRRPSDRLGAEVARALQEPGARRDRLTTELYRPADAAHPLRVLETALELSVEAAPLVAKQRRAARAGEGDVLTAAERALVQRADAARQAAIAVDEFTLDELLGADRRAASRDMEMAAVGG